MTEIISPETLERFVEDVDLIQVGARNMQNFSLLKELGRTRKPILLKRGLSATVQEWIMSAEYIMAEGNPNVILCERGIRTFEDYTRNTLDLSAVSRSKETESSAGDRGPQSCGRLMVDGSGSGESGSSCRSRRVDHRSA